jgi:hypothetical protein
MTSNGLKLLNCDEYCRISKEIHYREALIVARHRGCVIDFASSDVCLYLEGATCEDDYLAVEKVWPGYSGKIIFERP